MCGQYLLQRLLLTGGFSLILSRASITEDFRGKSALGDEITVGYFELIL